MPCHVIRTEKPRGKGDSPEGKARGKQRESRGKARGKQVQKRVSRFLRVANIPLFTVPVSSEIAPSYPFIILKGGNFMEHDPQGAVARGKTTAF